MTTAATAAVRRALSSLVNFLADPSLADPALLPLTASPGMMTLLDVALYQCHEGELTATVCSANVLLQALFELKRQAGSLLREVTLKGRRYDTLKVIQGGSATSRGEAKREAAAIAARHNQSDLAESFARACLDATNEVIDRMVTEPLADTANLQPSRRSTAAVASSNTTGGNGKSSNVPQSPNNTFHLDSNDPSSPGGADADHSNGSHPSDYGILPARRTHHYRRRDCWESQRLYCPDYGWADEVATACQRMIRSLMRHKFVSLVQGQAQQVLLPHSVTETANASLLLLRYDLPSKLHTFRAGIEADAVVSKRLYLVKCEYRGPFRCFLEAHQSVQRTPSLSVVNACLDLHKRNDRHSLHKLKRSAEQTMQEMLHHPKLGECLELEKRIEEVEIGMARMLLPFTEMARLMDSRKARLVAIPSVVSVEELPTFEELLRRLRPLLCRKAGSEARTGMRPLLLDLQGIPRDSKLASTDTFPFGTYSDKSDDEAIPLRVDRLLSQLQSLVHICCTKGGIVTEKGGLELPSSIIKGLARIDAELFQAQHADWIEMVLEQKRLEAGPGPSFTELSDTLQRAEIDVGVIAAPKKQLELLRDRLDFLEKDRVKRFEVLQEMVEEVCQREMNLEIDLTAPDQNIPIELPQMSELGLFGLQLQIVEEPLPLG